MFKQSFVCGYCKLSLLFFLCFWGVQAASATSSKFNSSSLQKRASKSTKGTKVKLLKKPVRSVQRSKARSQKKTKPTTPLPVTRTRYIWGGVVGTAIGFGIGHALVGEYGTWGWFFTTTQVASIGIPLLTAGIIALSTLSGTLEATGDALISAWGVSFFIGLSLYIGFRLWEIFDVWWRPTTRWEKTNIPTTTVAVTPMFTSKGGWGLSIVGSF